MRSKNAASFAVRVCSDFDPIVCDLRAVFDGTIGRNIGSQRNHHRSVQRRRSWRYRPSRATKPPKPVAPPLDPTASISSVCSRREAIRFGLPRTVSRRPRSGR